MDPEGTATLVLCGPVIGTVTENSAVVLLEVDEDTHVTCKAEPVGGGEAVCASKFLSKEMPGAFLLERLAPGTEYRISFDQICAASQLTLSERGCVVRTMPKELKRLRVIAVSCDWPNRLEDDEENPWGRVEKICRAGQCDVMLHLGDQVYTWDNGCMTAAMREMAMVSSPVVTRDLLRKMQARARMKLKESYLCTWVQPEISAVLANTSHLMIWSDNDVTNDFTVLRKPDGKQEYTPEYLNVAMRVYREYQRQLWDPDCCVDHVSYKALPAVEEWHFHRYGPCGVFLIDMRGNRILPSGLLKEGLPPILSQRQRKAIEEAFASPGMTCMLLCAEIPFVGEAPDGIREKAKSLTFLKDHWPYFLSELEWLLDLCFSWKAGAAGRDVIMLTGDIHVSVDSTITDSKTKQTLRHIVTSPITNSVAGFFPALEGVINERYSYRHVPLPGQRTFCRITLDFEEGGVVKPDIEMVCVPGLGEEAPAGKPHAFQEALHKHSNAQLNAVKSES